MAALLLGPGDTATPLIAIAVALIGLFVLAAVDLWREEVEDWATGILLAAVVGALLVAHITPGQWVNALLSAAATFAIYLWLGTKGVMGGGDVKLSVVPGLALGAVNPFLAIWWVAASIAIHQLMGYAASLSIDGRGMSHTRAIALPHVPAMAIAAALAVMVFPI